MSDYSQWRSVQLDSHALEFVRGRLGIGVDLRPGLPLRRALRQLPLEAGKVWIWAPMSAHLERVDFDGGLPAGITPNDHRDLLTHFLQDYLSRPGRFAILEDHDAAATDTFLASKPPGSFLSYEDYVYWQAARSDSVNSMLQFGLGLFNCIAMTRPSTRWEGLPPVDLTAEDIDEIANATEHVALDAFDFEGFLVWSRPGTT